MVRRYWLHIAIKENSFKRNSTTVTVFVRGEIPMLTIDNAAERMDSTAAMEYEYSKGNGVSWIIRLDNMDQSDLTNAPAGALHLRCNNHRCSRRWVGCV